MKNFFIFFVICAIFCGCGNDGGNSAEKPVVAPPAPAHLPEGECVNTVEMRPPGYAKARTAWVIKTELMGLPENSIHPNVRHLKGFVQLELNLWLYGAIAKKKGKENLKPLRKHKKIHLMPREEWVREGYDHTPTFWKKGWPKLKKKYGMK